ncbi:MAG: four helix bundle protein [Candidatus Omnitrophota bacterium]
MEEKIKTFKDLRIWQKAMEIVKDIYQVTNSFPKEELYGLTSQMRRCAVSLASNIAEGFKRYHNKEYKQFLHIMLGSAAELETQLLISEELRYINKEETEKICEKLEHLSRMTTVLIRKLK